MNIEDMIMNGASEEEIMDAVAKIQKEKAELDRKTKEHEERAKAAIERENTKDALKAEARAYLINALAAYAEAFDLVDEDGFSQEEIEKFEKVIISYENMIPMMIKLVEMQNELDKDLFGFGFKM